MNYSQPPPAAQRRPYEQWAELKQTPKPALDFARGANGWAAGYELTEAEFDEAVAGFDRVSMR